jgi:hypothetical protein
MLPQIVAVIELIIGSPVKNGERKQQFITQRATSME